MRITLRYWKRLANFNPDYNSGNKERYVKGENAKDCMKQIQIIRDNHDLAKYTPMEIINVED